jgi:dimethylhistidine N-methyltransferase
MPQLSPIAAGAPPLTVNGADGPVQRRAELLAGLMQPQACISPKFFYDEQGSALYGAITALDEYDLPQREASIFDARHQEISAALPVHGQWVDLGCGDGFKSWRWIAALRPVRYVGVDIAEPWLRSALQRAEREFPDVRFEGVVTDFTRGLSLEHVLQQRPEPCVLFYPGSSIGNFEPAEARTLLRRMREHLSPEGRLLIGVDGIKPRGAMLAAYDDALGVTAAFNRNVLRVVNRELGANFDPAAFDHRALFSEAHSRIEMHLVARTPLRVRLGTVERRFERGEAIVTEHSYKYTRERFSALLAGAGFAGIEHWSDAQGGYHVFVAAPAAYRQ